jgi:hypothetical protein
VRPLAGVGHVIILLLVNALLQYGVGPSRTRGGSGAWRLLWREVVGRVHRKGVLGQRRTSKKIGDEKKLGDAAARDAGENNSRGDRRRGRDDRSR